jgi:endonuclease V-like protein UPF0215 family
MIIEAFDDGYFPTEYKSRRGNTVLLGVKTLDSRRVIGITYTRIPVDGLEATDKIIESIKILGTPNLVLLDGITYAGFDVADPEKIYYDIGVPVVTIQQYPLDLERIKYSLIKHFPDWRIRYSVIEKTYKRMYPLNTVWKTIFFAAYGTSVNTVQNILRKLMIYSPVPEPLRIADKLASQFSKLFIRLNI